MDLYVPQGSRQDDKDEEELVYYECTDCPMKIGATNMVDADYRHRALVSSCRGIMVHPPPKESDVEDMVAHPKHYTFGRFEVIEVLEDWFPADPLLWQVGKYISRAGRKDSLVTDLEKAKWYLERRIAKAKEIK